MLIVFHTYFRLMEFNTYSSHSKYLPRLWSIDLNTLILLKIFSFYLKVNSPFVLYIDKMFHLQKRPQWSSVESKNEFINRFSLPISMHWDCIDRQDWMDRWSWKIITRHGIDDFIREERQSSGECKVKVSTFVVTVMNCNRDQRQRKNKRMMIDSGYRR